jgi:ABC-type nitrate/sulfonate/bicarbonate transport system permease component
VSATRRHLAGVFIYLRAMAALAIVWEIAARWTGNPVLLPSPLRVLDAIWALALELELFEHAAISLIRMLISVTLAAAAAIPLGLLMGRSRIADDLVDPLIEILRPISGIAWIPLALFLFGVGHALPTFIMFYAAFFPIVIGTIAGVRSVDRRLVDAARTMGVPRPIVVARVVMPAALPAILVALRLGVAAGWTAVVAAELVGAPSGLGYAVEWYRELLMTPKVMAFIAMIGVLGYLCDSAVRQLQVALTPWAPRGDAR